MTTLATLRMVSYCPHGLSRLVLSGPQGRIELEIDEQHVRVPYPWVRAALVAGWAPCDTHEVWPPRMGSMSPPKALTPGDVVTLPDGTELEVPAPFNQVMEFPARFIPHFESLGWHRLAQHA